MTTSKKIQGAISVLALLVTTVWLSGIIASASASVSVDGGIVGDLTARAKATKVQLTWTHIGADSYNIYRKIAGQDYAYLANTASTYSTYLDTPVVPGTTYSYVDKAIFDGVEGGAPDEATVTPTWR